jgi:hypothetical protein
MRIANATAPGSSITVACPSIRTPSGKTVLALPPPPMPIQLGDIKVTQFAGTPDQDVTPGSCALSASRKPSSGLRPERQPRPGNRRVNPD